MGRSWFGVDVTRQRLRPSLGVALPLVEVDRQQDDDREDHPDHPGRERHPMVVRPLDDPRVDQRLGDRSDPLAEAVQSNEGAHLVGRRQHEQRRLHTGREGGEVEVAAAVVVLAVAAPHMLACK